MALTPIQNIFAYNTGSLISGTTQVGDIAVKVADVEYSASFGGLQWWGGPDQTNGYVIAYPIPSCDRPTPIFGLTACLGFKRSQFLTEESFVELANSFVGGPPAPFANGNDASTYLTNNGYWNSWQSITPTPTATLGVTPTPSTTETPTPTPTESNTPTPTPTATPDSTATATPNPTTTPTPTPDATTTPTPTVTNTETPISSSTPTETPTNTPTVTPTNPALVQLLNETTGSRTILAFTLDGVVQPLTSGSYPIAAGQNGYALTHGTNSNVNGVAFDFGGSGTFDLYSYLNGNLVNYLSSYNSGVYTMGGTLLQSSDQVLLRITDAGALPTPTQTATQTSTPNPTTTPTPTSTPLAVTPTPTQAPFSVTMIESGSNVVLSFAGSLNLTGLDYVQNQTVNGGGVGAAQAAFGIGPSTFQDISLYTGATFSYPTNFGPGGGGPGGSVTGSGDYFGVFSGIFPTNCIVVPTGYTSNTYISGTTTLGSSTFSSLGMSAGTYNYSWGAGTGQSFTLTIGGPSPTPTPTPTSGATSDGWLFYTPEGPISGPPTSNGDTIFVIGGNSTFNPNFVSPFSIYFNTNNNVGTSYLSQFQQLDTNGGTIAMSQGSNTAIYSGTSSDYVYNPGFLQFVVSSPLQMIQSASTTFVSGTTINLVIT